MRLEDVDCVLVRKKVEFLKGGDLGIDLWLRLKYILKDWIVKV